MKKFLHMGKIASAVLFALGASSAAHAANDESPRYLMNLKVEGQAKVQEWVTINHLYTSWANQGGIFGCSEWAANTATIDWGTTFQQSRSCSQNQSRTATPVLFNPVLKTTKTGVPFQESRTITAAQFQPAIGARDFISAESPKSWSAWTDDGAHYGCDAWSPLPETVNLYQDFEQSRSCSQNQVRNRNVMDVWASGQETLKRTENDAQVISEVEKQAATGTKNFISGSRAGEWSVWADIGNHYGCGTWSPAVNTVNLQDAFTQSRSCSQDQTAARTIYDVWRDGSETVNREETKNQTIGATENQAAVGTKDYITTTRNGEWTAWSNSGNHYSCSTWAPTVDSKPLGEAFNQTRYCSQNQTRQRDIYNVWKSGAETLKNVEPGAQTISETETRAATGTTDYISGSRAGAWSAWTNDGAAFDCGVWSPDVATVNLQQSFTQSRSCSQKHKNDRNIYDVWASGTETLNRNEAGSQTISVTQNQGATGTKDFVTGVGYGAWSAWTDEGAPFSCGTWSPRVIMVNLGDTFTQSRSCTQGQSRSRAVYDVYKSGAQVQTSTENGSQNVSVTQNQSATGTMDYITGTRTGDWAAWANSGANYACGTWSPDVNTVNLGSAFTQTRSCSQDQTRSRTIYNVWKSGAETVNNTETGAQTISVTQSQGATGTKDYDTGTIAYGAWSAWTDSGAVYSCDGWDPLPETVNLGDAFTQSRACSQNQTRSRAVYQVWASGAQVQTGTDTGSQTVTVTKNQSSTGTRDYMIGSRAGEWSEWTNVGGNYACGAWSPATTTYDLNVAFTQTRNCSQRQSRTRIIYSVWKSGVETVTTDETVTQTIGATQSRSAIGTRDYDTGTVAYGAWSAWANSGAEYSCGTWSPAVATVNLGDAFTQSRSCSQNQTRSRTVYTVMASGQQVASGTDNGTQTISVTTEQAATGARDYITSTRTGTWGAWVDSGSPTACGTWSPATSTVNLGASFTQSRSCSQAQTRSRTIYNVWKSGTETVNNTEGGSQTISITQNQGATGTKDYDTGAVAYGAWSAWSDSGAAYSCGTWNPLANTVNLGASFTQNRSCSQNQTRTRPIYQVWASGAQVSSGTDTGSQTISVSQSQGATGTNDYVTGAAYSSWSSWSNSGGLYGCGGWSPSTGSVTWGQSFTQTRSCSQDQSRSRTVYDVWASGAQTTRSSDTASQTVSATDSRGATGTSDYIVSTSYGNWSGWSNDGGQYACGSWSPSPSTVNWGQSFTQTRSCSQDQTRSRSITNNWASGGTSSGGTDYGSRTTSVGDSQGATGTKDYVSGASYGSWSGWSNSGAPYGCGTWSPDASTVNYGSSFTQNRSCSQNQTQSRAVYSTWASGATTSNGTETASQTVSVGQSQGATGSKNVVTGSENGSGPWSPTGSPTCSAWSPSPSTVTIGMWFLQTRSCSQPYVKTNTTYNIWSDGTKTVASSNTESKTEPYTETQYAQGTMTFLWWTSTGYEYCAAGTPSSPSDPLIGLTMCDSYGQTQDVAGTGYCGTGKVTYMRYRCQ